MFNKQLKFYRKIAQISRKEIAQKLNITLRAYTYYESGEREPNINMLKNICTI